MALFMRLKHSSAIRPMRIYSRTKDNILNHTMKVIDKNNREMLGEGRSCGMAFAFLKKKKEDFEAVHALSPCKDYLNDIVYCEKLNTSLSACGLQYKHQGGVIDGERSYIAMKILDYQKGRGSKYAKLEEETKTLKNNWQHIQKLLNVLEDEMEIGRSVITPADDDYYVVEIDPYWANSTYAISLLTLILRVALEYDGKVKPKKYLNEYKGADQHMWSTSKIKVYLMLKGYKIKQEFDKKTGSSIHNYGIMHHQVNMEL